MFLFKFVTGGKRESRRRFKKDDFITEQVKKLLADSGQKLILMEKN